MRPDELQALVGQRLGTSGWITIDQGRIDRFADVTEDHQFIHIDPVRAGQSPFGGTIAHGFLTLSLIPHMLKDSDFPAIDGARMGVNYGADRLRFLAPVRAGKRVRGHFKLLAMVEKRPGEWQHTTEVTVEIEGEEKPALIAEWIGLTLV